MKFVDWEPHYIAILEYFGFEREATRRPPGCLQILPEVGMISAPSIAHPGQGGDGLWERALPP